MKILFLSDNFPPESNAAANRVYERAVFWAKWGHDVTVLTCAPNFPEGKVFEGYENKWVQREEIDGIKVVRVKTFMAANKGFALRILDFVSFMFMAFLIGLFQKRPDVIVATSPQFFAAVGGWMLSVAKWRPFVFELSDLWPASIKAVGAMKDGFVLRMVERFELFLYRRSARVIALTEAFKRDLIERGIDAEKIDVVRNGADLSRYQPQSKHAPYIKELNLEGKFVVGYIGTHGMAHALDNVLNAAALLKHHEEVRILLVGGGAKRDELLKQKEEQGLSNVIMLPRQPKETMADYQSICDVALVHLKNDPVFETVIPSKIFEAMAMGLPMAFAGPYAEGAEIIESEKAGLIAEGENPKALAEVIERLYTDAKLHKQLSENALNAAPRYSRKKQAEDFVAVLADVAGQPAQINDAVDHSPAKTG